MDRRFSNAMSSLASACSLDARAKSFSLAVVCGLAGWLYSHFGTCIRARSISSVAECRSPLTVDLSVQWALPDCPKALMRKQRGLGSRLGRGSAKT